MKRLWGEYTSEAMTQKATIQAWQIDSKETIHVFWHKAWRKTSKGTSDPSIFRRIHSPS